MQERDQNPGRRRNNWDQYTDKARDEHKRTETFDRVGDERTHAAQTPKKHKKEKVLLKSAPPVEMEQASTAEIFEASSMVVKPKLVKIETEEELEEKLKKEEEYVKNLAEKQRAEKLRIYYRQQREKLECQKRLNDEQKLMQKEENIQHKEAKKEARRLKKQAEYESLIQREEELSKTDPSSTELQEIKIRINELETGFKFKMQFE